MKQTTTEVFIEVEETICVISAGSKNAGDGAWERLKPIIEICPHCGEAIFGTENKEIEGELKI